MNLTVTLGGLAVGLAILMHQFLPTVWAMTVKGKAGKGDQAEASGAKFDIRAHAPFFLGASVGMLAISCPGGIVGTIAAKILGLSNAAGDKALSSGVGGATTAATRQAAAQMSAYGALVTLLLVIAVVILRKRLAKPQKKQLFAGVWCGSTLGLSSGAAGLTAAVLIPLAEQLGHALGGAV